MGQHFIAREPFNFSNGAIGWAPGGPFDCLGPYAKVENCPIGDSDIRRTAYATGYADTYFSIPACTRYRGRYIKGFFTCDDSDGRAIKFNPLDSYLPRFYDPVK